MQYFFCIRYKFQKYTVTVYTAYLKINVQTPRILSYPWLSISTKQTARLAKFLLWLCNHGLRLPSYTRQRWEESVFSSDLSTCSTKNPGKTDNTNPTTSFCMEMQSSLSTRERGDLESSIALPSKSLRFCPNLSTSCGSFGQSVLQIFIQNSQ